MRGLADGAWAGRRRAGWSAERGLAVARWLGGGAGAGGGVRASRLVTGILYFLFFFNFFSDLELEGYQIFLMGLQLQQELALTRVEV